MRRKDRSALSMPAAVRSGLCLPFGPQAAVISSSNIACITLSPAATLIASSPSRAAPAMSVSASRTFSDNSASPAVSEASGQARRVRLGEYWETNPGDNATEQAPTEGNEFR